VNELADFTRRISSFDSKTLTGKIEIFGWYLHEVGGKARFSPADLTKCFQLAHCSEPGNIYGLLLQLSTKKPARLLKDSQGYRLSAAVRDQIGTGLGRSSSAAVSALLSGLLPKVTDTAQKTFLEEALICFRNKAYRAAIVMSWNLTYTHVCDQIFANHLPAFNTQRTKVHPKLPEVVKATDFEDYGERQVVEICRGARIFDATVCKILVERLNRRNSAAHPSSAIFTAVQAEDMITDLVNNILLNPNV
jgi:hypothetical protein